MLCTRHNLSFFILGKRFTRLALPQIKFHTPPGAAAPSGAGPPHYQGFIITDAPHSVGLLWTRDQPDAETYT